jgi:hypothetical protein
MVVKKTVWMWQMKAYKDLYKGIEEHIAAWKHVFDSPSPQVSKL